MTLNISDDKRAEYFRRSYEAIDGLWFMTLEEEFDFERALEFDQRVWKIVPKIQARKARELFGISGDGLTALKEALEIKFAIEGAGCEIHLAGEGKLTVELSACPWFLLMQKSGRAHLAGRVGEAICGTEYPVWAKEFGCKEFTHLRRKICSGDEKCLLEFMENA